MVPVFLTNRREKALVDTLSIFEETLTKTPDLKITPSAFNVKLPKKTRRRATSFDLYVYSRRGKAKSRAKTGLWLTSQVTKQLPKTLVSRIWWWLPPVIWIDEEQDIRERLELILKRGGRHFVLNAPWQMAFFHMPKKLSLWAGPFCNIANGLAVNTLKHMGFKGAIVSPELSREDYFMLPKHSPLPLGIVVSGNWPLCISRVFPETLEMEKPFTSPKGEEAWIRKIGADYWVFPNWSLDTKVKQGELERAGYSLFVHLIEPLPKEVSRKKRPGLWNWELGLL